MVETTMLCITHIGDGKITITSSTQHQFNHHMQTVIIETVVSSMNTLQTSNEHILHTQQHMANHHLTVDGAHLLYICMHLLYTSLIIALSNKSYIKSIDSINIIQGTILLHGVRSKKIVSTKADSFQGTPSKVKIISYRSLK